MSSTEIFCYYTQRANIFNVAVIASNSPSSSSKVAMWSFQKYNTKHTSISTEDSVLFGVDIAVVLAEISGKKSWEIKTLMRFGIHEERKLVHNKNRVSQLFKTSGIRLFVYK